MKTLYLIRHAKSNWKDTKLSDFERGLSRKGKKDLKSMSSYIALSGVEPNLVLSSCALRAQLSIDAIIDKLEYSGKIHYINELYMEKPKTLLNVISLQDDNYDKMMLMGHNPELTELANIFLKEQIHKLPTLGLIEIKFEMEKWEDILETNGKMGLFLYPNQFKYHMPKKIREHYANKNKKSDKSLIL
ncbi:MAG: histidine phosphatase [Campylobacterales bacterium]|nr:histidine phosphatase [Campylobacterales bacterium]